MILDQLESFGLSPLIVGVILVLTLIYVFLMPPSHPADLPPMPVKPYPFFGHLYHMGNDRRKKFNEWRKTTGDIFSIYIGKQVGIVLSGYDVLKQALVKNGDAFSARPEVYGMKCFKYHGGGVIQSSGDSWKEQRTISLSILRSFGMGKSILAEKISEETEMYNERLAALNGQPSDIKTLTNQCVSNVICNIILGSRFDLDDPEFVSLVNKLRDFVIYSANTLLLTPYPWLRHIPGDKLNANKLKETVRDIENVLNDKFIEPLSQKDKLNEVDCFITEYMKEMIQKKENNQPTYMSKENLSAIIVDLFAAGTESTSTTLYWFVLFMLHHPHILKKIQDEMSEVVGSERPPSIQDRTQLHYLNACMMETQRKASLLPLSIVHKCNQTIVLNGYTIPKDALVMPNLDSVLFDETIWPEPDAFRPERFLDDKGHLKTAEELIPFSLGRRACLGEALAKMELFLFMANLCQRFHIRPAEEGKLPSLDYVFGIAVSPRPYEVRFVDRRK